MSHHETLARARKIARLVCELDRQLRQAKLDPHGQAGAIAVQLGNNWGPEQWARLAVCAGCHPPSQTTIESVLEVFRARDTYRDAGAA